MLCGKAMAEPKLCQAAAKFFHYLAAGGSMTRSIFVRIFFIMDFSNAIYSQTRPLLQKDRIHTHMHMHKHTKKQCASRCDASHSAKLMTTEFLLLSSSNRRDSMRKWEMGSAGDNLSNGSAENSDRSDKEKPPRRPADIFESSSTLTDFTCSVVDMPVFPSRCPAKYGSRFSTRSIKRTLFLRLPIGDFQFNHWNFPWLISKKKLSITWTRKTSHLWRELEKQAVNNADDIKSYRYHDPENELFLAWSEKKMLSIMS